MDKTSEQHAVICFCWIAGFSATKTFEMIRKLYSKSAVQRVLEGWESISDEQRSGRLMATRTHKNIARIVNILKEDHWSLYRLIAEWMRIPNTIVQQVLRKALQKWKRCVWFVPHALTAKQKEQRLNHAYTLLKRSKASQTF